MKHSPSLPVAFVLSFAASVLSPHSASAQSEPVDEAPASDAQVDVEVQFAAPEDTPAFQAVPAQAEPAQAQPAQAQPAQAEPVQAQPANVVPVDDMRGGYAPAPVQQPQDYQLQEPSLAHPGQLRLKVGFLLGFGGRQTVTVNDETQPDYSEGLSPSYGIEFDIQKNFGPVFFTSGTLRYTSLDLGGANDRFGVFGFDLGIGVHYAFDVGPIAIDPFFSAHAGLGFGSNGEYGAFGLAVALKLGASLWFHRMVGVYLAGGYRGSLFLSGAREGASGSNLRQGTMDLGVVFRFGE